MFILLFITAAAIGFGLLMPLRWAAWGALAGAVILFAVQVGVNMASGFAGETIEESLLLFNGSWRAYLGYNMQITYRAFALPLVALFLPIIIRLVRSTASSRRLSGAAAGHEDGKLSPLS